MRANETDFIPINGIRLGSAAAGIRYKGRDDLVVLEASPGSGFAAVFTRNDFCAAPVQLARRHLASSVPRYLLINSGNANAGTGDRGLEDASACCEALAEITDCSTEQVLPFSTGVIGEFLAVDRMRAALPEAIGKLHESGWSAASRAIMTTDLVPKLISTQVELDGEVITLTGMAKGAGMIRPDMATMLAFIATDAGVEKGLLQECLHSAVAGSFNSITVDGDTSTNDACILIASGSAPGHAIREPGDPRYRLFADAVQDICMKLARAIVRDGEGATKLVDVLVENALSEAEARNVAYTVAESPLVKTALFASDPNWGRILAAVGRAGVKDLLINGVEIWLDEICIVRDGGRSVDYLEEQGRAVMGNPEFTILIRLNRGMANARVLTCDLSYDYVRINAEYRT